MRKIYTAIAIMCFALGSYANQSTTEAQASETLGTDFLEFTITDQVTSTINTVDHTVSVTMPAGTDLTALVPTYTMSAGASSWLGTQQVSSTVDAIDYTAAQTYTIKNGAEEQAWVVTVANEPAEIINVTFNLTISEGCVNGKNVYLTGGFIGWVEPGKDGSILMTDDNSDGIYTAVVEIAANTNDRYKYFVGEGWNGGDITDGGCENKDRCLVLGTEDVTFDDVFDCIIAVNEDALSLVSMYPNPVSSQLTIANLEGVNKVVVSNLLGQALVTKTVSSATMTINTAEFKAGIYVVTLVSESGLTRSERIVKE